MTSHIDLSPKQEKIVVFAENGAIYVKASGGSGKNTDFNSKSPLFTWQHQ